MDILPRLAQFCSPWVLIQAAAGRRRATRACVRAGPLAWLVLACTLLSAFPGCVSVCRKGSEAARFDIFARETFKRVYPLLAEQILTDYQIRDGLCLDVGCGPGYLSMEMAARSELKVIGVDIDPEAVRIARRNVAERKLADRVSVEQGDVHSMRFEDNCADVIVSRGSFLFWKNPTHAFREIYRVLKPGGVAFIGGGMGRGITPEEKTVLKAKVDAAGFLMSCRGTFTQVMMQETLEAAGIRHYKIMPDGPGDSGCKCGMWVEIRKPAG
ncbi:MAG: class I SAM-dependent methyltransferase [Candidatus Eisenbacteria bacterium]|nr:class I SAM-dependent methyltransferase [Candidatus Eisenbacteria bacterium]